MSASRPSTFCLVPHHGIWRVTLDGAFFGDYRSKQNALDGLHDKTIALQKAGATVKVVAPTDAAQDDAR